MFSLQSFIFRFFPSFFLFWLIDGFFCLVSLSSSHIYSLSTRKSSAYHKYTDSSGFRTEVTQSQGPFVFLPQRRHLMYLTRVWINLCLLFVLWWSIPAVACVWRFLVVVQLKWLEEINSILGMADKCSSQIPMPRFWLMVFPFQSGFSMKRPIMVL